MRDRANPWNLLESWGISNHHQGALWGPGGRSNEERREEHQQGEEGGVGPWAGMSHLAKAGADIVE